MSRDPNSVCTIADSHERPRIRGIVRPLAACLACLLLVASLHWSHRRLPFWWDSVGYMIRNTRYMVDSGTLFQPRDHDTGHPPLCFLLLGGFWKLLGPRVEAGHWYQWCWSTLLVWGTASFAWRMSRRNMAFAVWGGALALVHPQFYTLSDTLQPEIPMAALLVWMLYGFHARRPLVFLAAGSLLLLTKVNAFPIYLFFVAFELLLFPAWSRFRNAAGRAGSGDGDAAFSRVWWRWILLAALACLPVCAWLAIHRLHQGYWIQSPQFADTTRFHGAWAGFCDHFFGAGRFAVFGTQGNFELAIIALAIFGISRLRNATPDTGAAAPFRPNTPDEEEPRHPLPRIALSLTLQGAALYTLYAAKEQVLLRYYLSLSLFVVLIFLLAAITAAAWIRPPSARGDGRRVLPRALALVVLAAFSVANYSVRLHPKFADRLPLLPGPVRSWLRNEASPNEEMNLQRVNMLWMTRRAIHRLERRVRKDEKEPIVATVFPCNLALRYPEAGFLRDGPLAVAEYTTRHQFLNQPWDYYLHHPFQAYEQGMPDDALVEARQVRVERITDSPESIPGLKVVLFRSEKPPG